MPDIPAAVRAELDRELAASIDALLHRASLFDGLDLIEANVALASDMLAGLGPRALAASAAALALHMHRSGGEVR